MGDIKRQSCGDGAKDVRPVPGYPGFFATADGEIVGPSGVVLAVERDYPRVKVRRNGKRVRCAVHSLVALAFHGPRPNGHDVDHLDQDRDNSRPDNLAYRELADNRSRTPGRSHNGSKQACKRGHPFTAANTRLSQTPKGVFRACRQCHRERRAAERASRHD